MYATSLATMFVGMGSCYMVGRARFFGDSSPHDFPEIWDKMDFDLEWSNDFG